MSIAEYIDLKIQTSLVEQELRLIQRENAAIMADGAALVAEKNELDPSSVRYQAIELALEQVNRRVQALKKWGDEVTDRAAKLSDRPPQPPTAA